MSKDLLHHQLWDNNPPESEKINNSEGEYSVWTWSCGMGWTPKHHNLSLTEARRIKTRYASTLVVAKIILEVE